MTAQTCTEQNIKDLLERLVRGVLAETRATPAAGTAPGLAPMNAGPIPVEIPARHVHLSTADAINLFGEALRPHKPLSQPGQFLSTQRVRLIGPKGVMDNVAVLGPVRDASQVEISKTDARALGRALNEAFAGRGGGKPAFCQGSLAQPGLTPDVVREKLSTLL